MPKVTQWLLRGALLALQKRKLVAKVDEELSVAIPLPGGQHHDARQIEIVLRVLLFAKVADHVVPVWFPLAEHIKVESVYLIPDVLMVEEKLGYVTQVLSVDLLLFGIELKHTHRLISVNLIAWRAPHITSF